MTRTYVTLEVSQQTYDEIAKALKEAGYDHVFHEGMVLMDGIALEPPQLRVHGDTPTEPG